VRARPAKASGKIGSQPKATSVKRKVSQPGNTGHRSVAGQHKAATKEASQLKTAPRMTQKKVVNNRRGPAVKATSQRKR